MHCSALSGISGLPHYMPGDSHFNPTLADITVTSPGIVRSLPGEGIQMSPWRTRAQRWVLCSHRGSYFIDLWKERVKVLT